MTHKYIGTKIVTAWAAEGKDGQPGYGVKYEDGYTSWSPKAQFEAAYRDIEGPTQALTFGDALHMLKLGKRVARAGWNGEGQWVRIFYPGTDKQFSIHEHQPDPAIGDSGTFMPFFGLKDTRNQFIPWQPSQGDMLAEDWLVI